MSQRPWRVPPARNRLRKFLWIVVGALLIALAVAWLVLGEEPLFSSIVVRRG